MSPKKSHSKKKIRRTRALEFDSVEEILNNFHIVKDLQPWEKRYLKLLQWSYVHEGAPRKMKGCINLLEPLKCEETLVRMDQDDVKAVLKIMGHNWPRAQKKAQNKKKNEMNSSTKALDELVVSLSQEENELVSWCRRPYCLENVRKNIKLQSPDDAGNKPLFFNSYDEEERLWGFVQRMEASARNTIDRRTALKSTARSPRHIKTKSRSTKNKKKNK